MLSGLGAQDQPHGPGDKGMCGHGVSPLLCQALQEAAARVTHPQLPGLTRAFLSTVTLTTGCGVLANCPIFLGFLCECSPGAASPFSSTKNNVWNWRPG